MQTVRLWNREDILLFQDTILRFIYESNRMSAYMDSYTWSDAQSKYEDLVQYLDEGKAIIFGAVEEENMIGFLWAYEHPFRDDSSRLYVSILHVDENYRSKGVGSILLDEAESYARKNGYGSVFLHTEAVNQNARVFYEAHGYALERVQLVKKHLQKEGEENDVIKMADVGGVLRLDWETAVANRERLTELFIINTKSHILSAMFDDTWAEKKIADLIEYLKRNEAIVVAYFEKKEIIGFVWTFSYLYRKEKRYLLNAITVFSQYRNQGIARQLFFKMEKCICCEEGSTLYTHVDASNKDAHQFYLSCGMQEERNQFVKYLE